MKRDEVIAAIKALNQPAATAALEALGPDPSDEALTQLLEATKASAKTPTPPVDPTARAARNAKKKPGRSPVRIGAKVTTSNGRGKVTAVDGDQVTVQLASGKTETIAVSALKAHMAVNTKKGKHAVPAAEAEGDVLNREDSWDDIMQDVRDAVAQKFGYGSPYYPGSYCYVAAVFDAYVIVSCGDDFYRIDWSQDAATDVVTLGDMEEVELQYVTTKDGSAEGCVLGPLGDDDRFLEADAKPGNKWSVLLIQEGMSKNRNYYPGETLREAAPLYENRPIYLHHAENPGRFGRSPADAIGFVKNVKAASIGDTTESGQTRTALFGTAVILDTDWRRKMVEAWEEGNPNFVGLSHDVDVIGRLVVGDANGPYKRAEKIEAVKSVDLVMNPAAGGRLMQMVAADAFTEADLKELGMFKKMIEAIKASKRADLIAALEALGQNATEDQVMALHAKLGAPVNVQEGTQAQPAAATTATATATPAATDPNAPKPLSVQEAQQLREVLASTQKREALLLVESTVNGSSLPKPIKERVVKRMTEAVTAGATLTKDAITADVAAEVEAYGKIFEGQVAVPGGGARNAVDFRMTKASREQFSEALDDFFGVKIDKKGTKDERYLINPRAPLMSFRNLYAQFTGDEQVTGRVSEAARLTESLDSTSFSHILGDSITRRMVAEYQLPNFQQWRGTIAAVVPLNDFRTQRRLRFGGYGNLAIVAQGAPYLGLTSPSDEEATYSPSKRGGTEVVTLEMIKNDDVGVIKRIPMRLGRAAGQTLYEFVFDFMRLNSTYTVDSTALAVAGHGNNLSTTALSASQLANARLVMRQQTDLSSGKRLGIMAKYIWVPSDLDDLSRQISGADRAVPDSSLSAQAAPAAPNPNNWWRLEPMVVDYWTDTNNWWVTAAVDAVPMIEVGFLDGREDPELFVQDQPNVGSLFTNDAITWKVRHIYGGVVEDFRGFFGGIVP